MPFIIVLAVFSVTIVGNTKASNQQKNADFYVRTAYQLWQSQKLSEMKKVLDEGLKKYPKNPELWDLSYMYYFLKNDRSNSLSAAKQAASLQPAYFRYKRLGEIHFLMFNNYKSSLIYFKKIEREIKDPSVYFMMAECHRKLKQNEQAVKYYKLYLKKGGSEKGLVSFSKRQIKILSASTSTPTSTATTSTTIPSNLSGPSDPPQPECCFNIWATGCNLGWACALLKYTQKRMRWMPADEPIARFLLTAAGHVRGAYFTCSKMNPAWPDWKNKQRLLNNLVTRFRRKPDRNTRFQIWNEVKGLIHWNEPLKSQVVYYEGRSRKFASEPTCGDKYFLLGFYLSYAQQSLKIAEEGMEEGHTGWNKAIIDGFSALHKASRVLEQYYLIRTGHCVPIKDLRIKARISSINRPGNAHRELKTRIHMLDKLNEELQRRMESKCVKTGHHTCGNTAHENTGKRKRFLFKITKVRMKPWTFGGEVYIDLKITLLGQTPLTFKLNVFCWHPGHSWGKQYLKLKINWMGRKRIFSNYCLSGGYLIHNGRTTNIGNIKNDGIHIHLRPHESIAIKEMEMISYNTHDWGAAELVRIEYIEGGQKVVEFSPIISPVNHWRSWAEMARGVPPRVHGFSYSPGGHAPNGINLLGESPSRR